jgi:hypothetical protein
VLALPRGYPPPTGAGAGSGSLLPAGPKERGVNDELQIGLSLRDKAAAANQDLIEKLVPIARELARKAYPQPILMANVRLAAVERGILPALKSKGRELSGLGVVAQRAGLRPGGWQRSQLVGSHGNLQREWYAA